MYDDEVFRELIEEGHYDEARTHVVKTVVPDYSAKPRYNKPTRETWRLAMEVEQRAGEWVAFNALADEYLEHVDEGDLDIAASRIMGHLETGNVAEFEAARTAFKRKNPSRPKFWERLYAPDTASRLNLATDMASSQLDLPSKAGAAQAVRKPQPLTPTILWNIHAKAVEEQEEEAKREQQDAVELLEDMSENFERYAQTLHDLLSPAIFLKPHRSEDSDPTSPCWFGGKPKMPAEMAWPVRETEGYGSVALHFLAQFDCAALPRDLTVGGRTFSLPDFPKTGTFYLFMPLLGDETYEVDGMVFYRPEAGAELSERDPPDAVSKLREKTGDRIFTDSDVDSDAIQPCGKLLVRQEIVPIAYLSARGENPLRRNMSRDAEGYDTRRDMLDAFEMISLARVKDEGPKKTSRHNFGSGSPPFQMFGQGYVVQTAADDYADHVMMMQVGACHGLPMSDFGGGTGLFQFWMKPDDLKAQRFDAIFVTQECT